MALSENKSKENDRRTAIKVPVEVIDEIYNQTDCSSGEDVEKWVQQAIEERLCNQERAEVDGIIVSTFLADNVQDDLPQRDAALYDLINDHIMLNPSLELIVTDQR